MNDYKMDSLLTNLKYDLHCSLCNDTFIEPKILKCFHSFCKPCIRRHAKLIDEANVFKCPQCSSESFLPELNSVDDLKSSLIHSRMLKVLEFVESEKVCSVSESHSPASWYCFDCNRSICDACSKNHIEFNKYHQTTSLDNLTRDDLDLMLKIENYCQDHKAQMCEFYCRDCEEYICVQCLKSRQCRAHNTIHLEEYTSLKKTQMQNTVDQLTVKQDEMKKQVAALQEITSTTKQNGERAKTDVQETVKRLIAVLKENENEVLKEIEQRIEKAENQQAQGQLVLNQTQSVLDYLAKLMESGVASEIDAALIDVEGYNNCIDSSDIQESRFKFVPSKDVNKLENSNIGILKPMLTDPKMSVVKLDPETTDLEALKKAHFILTTKTSTGKLNDDPYDVVDVKFSPENTMKNENNYVKNEGQMRIEFMADAVGELTAEVKVNGEHVSTSPLVMNVNPQQMKITREFKEINKLFKNSKTNYSRNYSERDKPLNFKGIAINKENNTIALTRYSSHCLRIFSIDGDPLLTFGSHGSGQGQLSTPCGLSFLNKNEVVIADCDNHRLCIVNTTTGTLVKALGERGKDNGQFTNPRGVHVDDGNIIVSDNGNHRVQVFTKDGDYQYQFGLTKQDNFGPVSTVTHRALFYVSDFNNHVIHVFEKKGNVPTRISTIGGYGSADGQLSTPWGLAIDNDHNLLVCDRGNNRIQKFTLDGRFVGKMEVTFPCYMAVLKDDNVLLTADRKVLFVK